MGAIAGIMPRGTAFDRERLTAALGNMRDALEPRASLEGGMAVAYDASIALAHRGGAGPGAEAVLQPLRNERGTLWLVADGEPSNATALRLELIAAGHSFQSACGSEAILHLYEQDGIGALERLAGSFAFALWDREQHELILGRDRFGAKPLYVSDGGGSFAFASETRALGVGGLDPAALLAYLTLGYVPEPMTVASGVRAVVPGTLMRVRATRSWTERLWVEPTAVPSGQPEIDRVRFGSLLRESVESAIEGEDDVGVVVDGGVPTTALLALVRPMLGRGLRAHRFHFVGGGDGRGHRSGARPEVAAEVAGWFRGEPREHAIDATMLAGAFGAAAAGDQPSVGAPLATLTAGAMRAAGERVWLAGLATPQLLGADPARFVSWLWRAGRHGSTGGLTRAAARLVAHRRPFGRAAALAGYVAPSDAIAPAYLASRGILGPLALAKVMRDDALAHARDAFDPVAHVDARALSPHGPSSGFPAGSVQAAIARAVAAVDLTGPLMSSALRDAEASAVAHGLALRVPFLDHRLHEWVMSGDGSAPRPPLVAALQGTLPASLLRRLAPPPAPPLGAWMRGELRPVVESHILAPDPDGLFHTDALAELWRSFLAGHAPSAPVWSIATVRAWLSARRAVTSSAGPERRRRAA